MTEEAHLSENIVPMTLSVQIPSAIGLSLLILIGIGGNVLTIIAYFRDRHLNKVYDFFILNLALTDLLLCNISMPFYAVYTLLEFKWPFGYSFCKVWLVFDFTLCFESILLMLILSSDRILLISLGPVYMQKVTKSVAYIEITVSWIISFLVYGPAIIGWNHWVEYSTVEYMDCDVEFAYDHKFTTATSVVEFILPFVCLTSLNLIIYYKIRRRIKVSPTKGNPNVTNDSANIHEQGSTNNTQAKPNLYENPMEKKATNNVQTNKSTSDPRKLSADKYELKNTAAASKRSQGHMKAAKFLAILVATFLIFWAPYTVTTMTISFCDECVNTSLYEFFNWLLWMKSAVNPFLYAFNSPRYRKFMLKCLTLNGRVCKRNVVGQELQTTVSSVN